MAVNDIIKTVCDYKGIIKREVAEKYGEIVEWRGRSGVEYVFDRRLRLNQVSADDFIRLLDELGIEIVLMDKETGDEVRIKRKGDGERVRKMIRGKIYDTRPSKALSNNFDDGNEELYVNKDGEYFMASYGEKDTLRLVTEKEADEFVAENGRLKWI